MKFSIQTLIWTTIALALVFAGVFALIPKPVNVESATVIEGPLQVTIQEDGKTRIREKYIISAPVSGRLARIKLKAGDTLVGDETLVSVILPSDPVMLDARARAEAEARVKGAVAAVQRSKSAASQAKIDHDLAEAKYQRAQGLLETKAISLDEYDIAKARYLASLQAISTAKFESEISRFELDMARAAADQFSDDETSTAEPFEIVSPISGSVLRLFQESATVVAVGTPLVEVGDPHNLEIEIDVLSTDAVRIHPGALLTIEHWGGESPLTGNVRVIEPAAFTKVSSLGVEEQRVNIIADFAEPPERIVSLGDGYRVEARISVKEIPVATLIPNSALFRQRQAWHVMKIVDHKAQLQPVEVGLQNESHSQILNGLSQGEKIIIYPSDKISAGSQVRVVNDSK